MPFEANDGNETSFTKDYSDSGYNGTVIGATWNATGGHDGKGAYEFDGINDYIYLPIYYDQSNQIKELTSCSWFKTSFSGSSWNSNWALLDFDRSDYYDYYVRGDTGAIGFSTSAASAGTNDFYSTTTGLNDGAWHHTCIVYDGLNKYIYIDGNLDATNINSHSGFGLGTGATRYGFIGDGSEATSLNGSRNKKYYEGSIDELQIFNIALSAEQIANLYEGNENIIASEETTLDETWQSCV
ncbi:MAG: LamG domain-containing protein, partial [Gammaproteobacteria bacterium]|nr:LamG domain-containing protein [Gammaproteobacteria bacterium]